MMSEVVKVSDSGNVFTILVAPLVNVNPTNNEQANGDNDEEETQPAKHE